MFAASHPTDAPSRAPGDRLDSLATALLILHGAIIVFSTVALVTILAGQPPAWLSTDPARTIYVYGWRLSGPSYVTLGALATITHAAARFGWRRAALLFIVGFTISLAAELTGTRTGYPFGSYSYTPLLGYRVMGRVPFPIPMSWFYMLYCSLAICGRLFTAGDGNATRWRWAAIAGLVLTAWDVAMDPAMTVATNHWIWHTNGFFYGMPLTNWFGWWLTGTLVARAMLAIVSPTRFAGRVSSSRFPFILYALNGVMPIALCLRHQLWWAAGLGALAMGTALTYSFRIQPRGAHSIPLSA